MMLKLSVLLINFAVAGLIVAGTAIAGSVPVQNPWFDMGISYLIYSGIVSGMPEPCSGPPNTFFHSQWYLWAYRTLHIWAMIGTPYAGHRNSWEKAVPLIDDKNG